MERISSDGNTDEVSLRNGDRERSFATPPPARSIFEMGLGPRSHELFTSGVHAIVEESLKQAFLWDEVKDGSMNLH